MDSQFVEKVIQEVKSQGVFDDFRKDSLADVDTKPAYQNLRNRVESAVKNFLSEQKWTPDLNKIQLREKLRKHITELGFLDVGVERIVDQVVNPKIATVFQPKIELIAYKYLGISPPEPPLDAPPPTPPILGPPPLPSLGHISCSMLNVETSVSLLPTDLEQISPDSDRATVKSDIKEDTKDDDDDLPPGVDADDGQYDDDISPPFEPLIKRYSPVGQLKTEIETDTPTAKKAADGYVGTDVRQELVTANQTDLIKEEVFRPFEAGISQDSQLSQVSSDSRLTAVSSISGNNAEPIRKEKILMPNDAVNISEEAQMPNFNENSCEVGIQKSETDLHFDIKKDAIKFEGTERKSSLSEVNGGKQLTIEDAIMSEVKKNLENEIIAEEANLNAISTPNAAESSFGSCGPDDTQSSVNPKTVDDDEQPKNTDGEAKENIIPRSEPSRQQQEIPELPDHSREELIKPSTPSSSTSSSRHKKSSSKDKRHHSDDRTKHRSRSKDRDRDRSRDKSSHSHRKHSSSSSSKHSSTSGLKHSSYKSVGRDKSSSTHSSSTSSSRSSNTHDSSVKRSDRRTEADRKHKSHSSKSDVKDLKNSSSTSKKTERDRQKATVSDDHNESKIAKSVRRRSNDSNDDDKSSKSKVLTSTTTSALSSPKSNINNNTDEATNGNGTQDTNGYKQASSSCHDVSKVVILNDILQQPSTDYIELTAAGKQVIKSIATDRVETIIEANVEGFQKSELKCAIESDNLSTIDGCRSLAKTLRVEDKIVGNIEEDKLTKIHEEESVTKYGGIKRELSTSAIMADNDDICNPKKNNINGSDSDDSAIVANNISPQSKRLKRSDTEISPMVSDASSVSSKENEVFEKDEADPSGNQLHAKISGGALNKLCQQQRYTNDDLYKPRPVLSQRPRRRHLNYAIP